MQRTARKEHRTLSELVRETFRRYQREEEDRQIAADPIRAQRLLQLKQAVSDLRNEASLTGAGKLTTRQVNAEIEAYRRQKRKKTISQPLR